MSIPNADFDDKNDDHVRDRQHKVNGMEYSKHIYIFDDVQLGRNSS